MSTGADQASPPFEQPPSEQPPLEQLLGRPDIWRGYAAETASTPAGTVATGFARLNALLVEGGWPKGLLVEIGQPRAAHFEWFLLGPALRDLNEGLIFLLNPPARPCALALLQAGLDLDRLVVVEAAEKADFVASFLQLTRARAGAAVLAWTPKQPLSYPELRKCQLAAGEGDTLSFLFRPSAALQQASPAALRLALAPSFTQLQVQILKQRGALSQADAQASLALPRVWLGGFAFHSLTPAAGDAAAFQRGGPLRSDGARGRG